MSAYKISSMVYEKTYPNGYKIVQDADLIVPMEVNGKPVETINRDYKIVNPAGKAILHGSNLKFLEKIVGNSKWLANAEADGGISG